MASSLESFVDREVSIITTDGRHYVGVLKGFDQAVNLVLGDCKQLVWNGSSPKEEIDSQNLVIRGDTVMLVGLKDSSVELPTTGEPLNPI